MAKNIGVAVGSLIVVLALLGVLFWVFRGRPAGEEVTAPGAFATPTAVATLPTPIPEGGVPPGAEGPGTPVTITAEGFSPATVTITPQTGVTFTNADTEPHQVASVPHPVHTNYPPLNGPVLGPGESFTVPFDTAGTFGYHDHLNPGVLGSVVVE